MFQKRTAWWQLSVVLRDFILSELTTVLLIMGIAFSPFGGSGAFFNDFRFGYDKLIFGCTIIEGFTFATITTIQANHVFKPPNFITIRYVQNRSRILR